MNDNRPLPTQDEEIAPDLASPGKRPLDPAVLMRREREKYGETDVDPNLQDQEDEHAGQAEDIV